MQLRTRSIRAVVVILLLVTVVGCQAGGDPGAAASDTGTTDATPLRTAADTIAWGRDMTIHHGCGDCHGGGDNPAAPMWLVGFREGTDDTLFWPAKIPTPDGVYNTRPRNLTPDNETGLGRFTERQIFNALRYGLRPGETPDIEIMSTRPGEGNHPENPKYLAPPMPWLAFRHMPDRDLWAISAYLKRGLAPQTNKVEPSEGPPDFWTGLYAMIAGPPTPPAFPTAQEVGTPPN